MTHQPGDTRRALVWCLVLAAAAAPAAQFEVLEQIVVRVNGDAITQRDIDERVRVTAALAGTAPTADAAADIARLPGILSDAVDEILMMQRAAELGLEVTDAAIDSVVATVRADSHADTEQAFADVLEREGITLARLRASIRRQLAIDLVRQHLFRRVSVSDQEVRRELDRGAARPAGGRRVTFRKLCVPVPLQGTVTDAERDRALVRVVAAGDKLASGTDFTEVAGLYPEAADGAALVGPMELGGVAPWLRKALGALRPGETSRAVAVPAGYCFLKVEAEAPPASYRERRDATAQRLLADKQRLALDALLSRLRASALLDWKRPDLRALYER